VTKKLTTMTKLGTTKMLKTAKMMKLMKMTEMSKMSKMMVTTMAASAFSTPTFSQAGSGCNPQN
jgi:hypothetical protein